MSRQPAVSVVIPTFRRPHLVQRSVTSALRQSFDDLEVLVVIDGTDDGTRAVVDGLGDARTRVLETGHNRGPAAARNYGVMHANGQYIALLDDDDEWTPEKLTVQMKLIEDQHLSGDFLVTCRDICKAPDGSSVVYPRHLLRPDEDFSEYILDRRLLRRNGISSGTLLFPRTLALRIPFPDDPVMEDYAWLLLCAVCNRTQVYMCPQAMFIYHLAPNSRNITVNWRLSLDWVRRYRRYMSGRAAAGLLASAIARRAKRQGGYRAFAEIARAMHSEGEPLLRHWLILGGIALMPSNIIDILRQFRA